MLELMQSALKGGFKTSEFWLAALAVVLPYAGDAASKANGLTGVIATGAVAAVYAGSRAYVKGKAIKEAAPQAASEVAATLVDTSQPLGSGVVR